MSDNCRGCGVAIGPARGPGRVREWCSERCRKRSLYSGVCEVCGGPTYGGDAIPPAVCGRCVRQQQHDDRAWTRETVVDAIRRWADEHDGVPPVATDWNHAGKPAGFPYVTSVMREFGGLWAAAIEAAGFERPEPGKWGRDGEDMDLCVEIRARYEAGEQPGVLAAEYGCGPNGIAYRVWKAGGRRRTHAEAMALRRVA